MKKIFLSFVIIALSFALNAQTSVRALFIGNSYIYTNDLPTMLQTLASGCGDTLDFAQSTPGGCTFARHLQNNISMSYIAQSGWDCVILQEQSQYPSFPIGQVQSQCFPYAHQLCDHIRTENPNANVMFFMTWGRKNGDADNCALYPPLCTYEGMDSLLYERYMMMAEENSASVSPVGRVWHVIRQQYPEIELYSADESHPSVAGTYAAAVTFYTMIFRSSPSCINKDMGLDATTAQRIRQIVETVVYDSLDFWYQFAAPVGVKENDAAKQQVVIYPNPVSDFVHVSVDDDHASGSVEVLDLLGRRILTSALTDGNVDVNLSDCQSGVYIFRIILNGRVVNLQKVVKK